MTLRTFTAVQILPTPALRQVLADLGELPGVRAVLPDTLHVTLKFLGDTDEQLLPRIKAEVTRLAGQFAPCELRLRGLGVFPNLSRATVVWVGLNGAETLRELTAELETALEGLGIPRDARAFQPHLTVARIKQHPPRELGTYVQQHAATGFGACWFREVEFLQSELRPEGPRYTVLAAVPLHD